MVRMIVSVIDINIIIRKVFTRLSSSDGDKTNNRQMQKDVTPAHFGSLMCMEDVLPLGVV